MRRRPFGRSSTGRRATWRRHGLLAGAIAIACLLAFSTGVARADSTGSISGTVTNQSSSSPLSNIVVSVYPEDYSGGPATGTATTAVDGTYTVSGLAAGSYWIEFYDPTGTYAEQIYDGHTVGSSTDWVTVTAGSTTPGIDAALELGGKISGTVTDGNGIPLSSIWACVYVDGAGGYFADRATDVSGTYTISGLAPGSYNVQFVDFAGDYASEWYDSQTSQSGASVITVSAGRTVFDIDAVMQPVPGAIIKPMNAVLPTLSGTAVVGRPLACSSGTWSGVPAPGCTYRWLRDGTSIRGATSTTYTVQRADCGHRLSCQVTATNSGGSAIAASNSVAVPRAPALTLKVSLRNLILGKTVTVRGTVRNFLAAAKTVTVCRRLSGKLRALKHVKLSNAGAFRWTMKAHKAGRWVLVATYKADGHIYTSKAVTVTVRQ